MGDEEARALGLRPGWCAGGRVAACALAAASAVAVSGLIGFVGIVVPHVVRRLAGPLTGVLPLSLLIGAGFLVLADTLARTVLSPAELPIGVVTALIGSPVFIWILRSTGRRTAHERARRSADGRRRWTGRRSCAGVAARPAGGWLALIGPNGAGKSTLLRAVAGLLPYQGDGPYRRRPTCATARPGAGPAGRLRAADAGAAAGHHGRRVRAARAHPAPRLPRRPRPSRTGPGPTRRRAARRRPLRRAGGWRRCPAASGSGWCWPGRWPRSRGCCCSTSRPRCWTSATSSRCSSWSTTCAGAGGLTVVSTLHDLTTAGQYADALVLLHEGRVVAAGPPPAVLTAGLIEPVYAASVAVSLGRDGRPTVAPVRRRPPTGRADRPGKTRDRSIQKVFLCFYLLFPRPTGAGRSPLPVQITGSGRSTVCIKRPMPSAY